MEDKRIRALRGRLDLSQERFAHLLGVSLQTVRRWEGGLSKPLPLMSLRLEELQRETEQVARERGESPFGGRRERMELDIGFGLGGLFKGIGSLLEVASKLAAGASEDLSRQGEVKVEEGKVRGVYGFTVRVGLGGKPIIEQFGNIQETESGPIVAATREPLVDVLEEEEGVRVIAELPGIREGDIRLQVQGDLLELRAESGERKYAKEILLPFLVDAAGLESAYRNGILEVKLPKRG